MEPEKVVVEIEAILPGVPFFLITGFKDLADIYLFQTDAGSWRSAFHMKHIERVFLGDPADGGWPQAPSLVAEAFPELVA